MSATLSAHAVLIAYWAVMLVLCAFFLRMACSLCRMDLPSWRRSLVDVVVVMVVCHGRVGGGWVQFQDGSAGMRAISA